MPSLAPDFDAPAPVKPVQIVTCPVCHGDGLIGMMNGDDRRCTYCAGRGQIATNGGEL